MEVVKGKLHPLENAGAVLSEEKLDSLGWGGFVDGDKSLEKGAGEKFADVGDLVVFSLLALVEEGAVGVCVVLEDLKLIWVVHIEGELEALVFYLLLLALEHIEQLDELFRVDHAAWKVNTKL